MKENSQSKQVSNPHYLFSGALHDFYWNSIDFVVHLHRPPLAATDLYQEHAEVGPSEVQGEEVSILCMIRREKKEKKKKA